jgi:hypothetical protein
MPQWPVGASNSILVSGVPLEFEYETTETTWPGMGAVLSDSTNKWEIDLCQSGENIICIVDISMASLSGRGSWRYDSAIHGYAAEDDTATYAYADNDQAKCISGTITVMLLVAGSQDIVQGMKLQCVGDGKFGEFECTTFTTVGVDPCAIVAEAMEDLTTLTAPQYIHAKLLL